VREPEEYTQDAFNNLYAVAVLTKLRQENLILVTNYLKLGAEAVELVQNLSKRFPLPSYDVLSKIIHDILHGVNQFCTISQEDIKKLCVTVEVNNGYVL
jgi:septum formation topological specificity factor MinE